MNDADIDEKLNEIWQGELLGRRQQADLLYKFLQNRPVSNNEDGYVLNLDAGWGEGKTYFLTRLQKQLDCLQHPCVLIDAWKNDHVEDPLIMVMSAIKGVLASKAGGDAEIGKSIEKLSAAGFRILGAVAKGLTKTAIKKFIGEGLEEINEIMKGGDVASSVITETNSEVSKELQQVSDEQLSGYMDKLLLEHARESETIEVFKQTFSSLISKISDTTPTKLPMYILIDELDRCRPLFAIELLERVKHLFGIQNTVFIIATDSRQLQHSICAVYGGGFDSKAYLRRFFNKRYEFPEADRTALIDFLFSTLGENRSKLILPRNTTPEYIFKLFADANNLTPRDIEQCFSILDSALRIWSDEVGMQMLYFLALTIGFHLQDDALVEYLVSQNSTVGAESFKKYKDVVLYKQERQRSSPENVLLGKFLSAYIQSSKVPLPNLGDNQGRHEDWVLEQLRNEFQMRFRGMYSSENPPYSVLRDYPKMIASALQFTN